MVSWSTMERSSFQMLQLQRRGRANSRILSLATKLLISPNFLSSLASFHPNWSPFASSALCLLISFKSKPYISSRSCIVKLTSQNHTRRRGTTSRNLKLCWYHWAPRFSRWTSFVSQPQLPWFVSKSLDVWKLLVAGIFSVLLIVCNPCQDAARRNQSVPIHSWILSWYKVWISCRLHKSQNADGKTAARS